MDHYFALEKLRKPVHPVLLTHNTCNGNYSFRGALVSLIRFMLFIVLMSIDEINRFLEFLTASVSVLFRISIHQIISDKHKNFVLLIPDVVLH